MGKPNKGKLLTKLELSKKKCVSYFLSRKIKAFHFFIVDQKNLIEKSIHKHVPSASGIKIVKFDEKIYSLCLS